jgi:hypothetical protein
VKGLRWVAAVLFSALLVWLVAGRGWDAPGALQLVRVLDVAPREVEPGDRIGIAGEGFPSGRPARVTFRGVLHRPGSAAQDGAEVSVWGTVVAPDRVEVAFDDATEALFCGAGDRAVHTTFEGALEVAFASAMPGAPPISGFLGGVTFDVRPGPTADATDRDHEADRLLAFLGIHLVAPAHGVGLLVDAVESGSRAEAAGLASGDVIESFDGVRVRSTADLTPNPDEREATVAVRRVSLPEPVVKTVSVVGFVRELPLGWVASAWVVLAALGIVLFFAAPTPLGVSTWIQYAIRRARERLALHQAGRSLRGAAAVAWKDIGHEITPASGPFAVVDAAACALIALLPFGQFRLAQALDVGVLFLGSATALAAAALVSGTSFGSRARRSLHVVWQHVPAFVAVACAVFATGSLRLQEIASVQGGWPWGWLAFRTPATLVAFVLFLSCTRMDLRAGGEPRESPSLRAVVRAHRIVVSVLAAVMFLGAWSLPGVTLAEEDAHLLLKLAGVACLMAKTAAVLGAMAWSRWIVPPLSLPQRSRLAARWLLPVGLATFGASALWSFWSPPHAIEVAIPGCLLICGALAAAALLVRMRHGLVSLAGEARLSPFL